MAPPATSPEPTAEALLKQHAMRVTPQRRQVLGFFLRTAGRHWSADQVRDQLLPDMPELARGTTYKALNELVRVGVLEELATADGMLLYGLRLVPHQHFFCEHCRRWFDIQLSGQDRLTIEGDAPGQIQAISVTLRGLCHTCAHEAPRSTVRT